MDDKKPPEQRRQVPLLTPEVAENLSQAGCKLLHYQPGRY
jgi:hypothetical protein